MFFSVYYFNFWRGKSLNSGQEKRQQVIFFSIAIWNPLTLIISFCRCCCFFSHLGNDIPYTRAEKVNLFDRKCVRNINKPNCVFLLLQEKKSRVYFPVSQLRSLHSPLYLLSRKGYMRILGCLPKTFCSKHRSWDWKLIGAHIINALTGEKWRPHWQCLQIPACC